MKIVDDVDALIGAAGKSLCHIHQQFYLAVMLLAVTAVLNGQFDDNFNIVAKTSRRNELVLLLAMKRNKEALELSKQLPDDEALSHYLRATCLNRMEQPIEAYEELKKAFKMDPSLKRTAELDGDVNDLLLDKQHNK